MSIQNLLVDIIRVSALPSVRIAGFFILYIYPNSTLNIQHSTLNIQHSTFNIQHFLSLYAHVFPLPLPSENINSLLA